MGQAGFGVFAMSKWTMGDMDNPKNKRKFQPVLSNNFLME